MDPTDYLAPFASISTSFGGFNGNLIAGSLSGSIETHIFNNGSGPSTPFEGTIRVPEPATLSLLTAAALVLARGRRVIRA